MFKVETITVSPFSQNCRVLYDSNKKICIVIDPGADANLIINSIKKHELEVTGIWLTHSHLDHCGAVSELLKIFPCQLVGSELEKEFRAHVEDLCSMYGIGDAGMKNCPEPTKYLRDGELLTFGDYEFKAIFTPGHAPGHFCFYFENNDDKILIAGDTLFAGSIGRTDLPGGNHQQLITNIKSKILTLPETTRVLSGHGPDTTVGAERKSNPFLQ